MINLQVITRKEAQASGLNRFYTGLPCARGHVAQRYVNRSFCVECKREDNGVAPDRTIPVRAPAGQLISKDEAKRLGLFTYYTGIPCRNGHDSDRYVRSGACTECARVYRQGSATR